MSVTAKRHAMDQIPLYPLRFEPIYQYRLWGGRRLANLLSAPLPGDGPIGEAWLLSDREDHPSRVADGPLKGRSIGNCFISGRTSCWENWPGASAGSSAAEISRRVRNALGPGASIGSAVPVYSAGETGKTEAWVVLEAEAKAHLRGLKPATTTDTLRPDARERNGGGLSRLLHSEARRRNFHTGWNRSFAGRRGGFEVQEIAT